MLARQALRQGLEAGAAIPGAVDHQRATHRHPALVGHCGHEPGGGGVGRVGGHRKAETRQGRGGDALPGAAAVAAVPDAAMVLAPQHLGPCNAAHDAVRVLGGAIGRAVGRHEVGQHAAGGELPARAVVQRGPGAAAADAHHHLTGPRGVGADRVDARHVVAATEPVGPLGHVPQAVHQLPGLPAIGRTEQTARQGTGPDGAARGFE